MKTTSSDIQKQLEQDTSKRPENTDNRHNRKERVPFGTPRGKLDVKGKEPGFHYAWVNEDKVDARLEEGFELVTHPVSVGTRNVSAATLSNGSICVTLPVGAGVTGFLMRIPQELYDQDVKYQNKIVDQTEETMRAQLKQNGLSGTLEIARKKE